MFDRVAARACRWSRIVVHVVPPPTERPRSRPTKRRYALRRLGALAVVLLVGYSLVRMVSGAVGDDDPVADAESTILVTASAGDGAEDGIESTSATGSASLPSDTSTPEAIDTDHTAPATGDDPAKVFIVGDSDAGTFGPYLERLLDGTGVVETELDYKVSSGLSRPDFFDWPAHIDEQLPVVDPDIVIATFGGNDGQGLAVGNGDFIVGDPVANEAEWTEEYQRRAGEVMDQLRADGRTLIWVGIPNDDNPEVTARMAVQDNAAKAAAAERPDVIFIDTWKRFSGRDGNWAEFVIDPRDGVGKPVRAGDGFHLNENGAEILALDIAAQIRDVLRAQGSDI